MICEVIIPTYQSGSVLRETLAALNQQQSIAGDKIRVIISDDGSTDHTKEVVDRASRQSPWEYRYLYHHHAGVAAARNQGLMAATGDIILFLGADIILRPGALKEHLKLHQEKAGLCDAGLGMIKWDPRLNPSPLMEWMTHGGQQNNFDALLGKKTANPKHFTYGSHISFKRQLLSGIKFSEQYQGYGWEDLDFGRTLQSKKGLTLHVLHNAVGLHRHRYATADIKHRQYISGQGLVLYQQHYPNEVLLPQQSRWQRSKYRGLQMFGGELLLQQQLRRVEHIKARPRLFLLATTTFFWRGVYKKMERQQLQEANKANKNA